MIWSGLGLSLAVAIWVTVAILRKRLVDVDELGVVSDRWIASYRVGAP